MKAHLDMIIIVSTFLFGLGGSVIGAVWWGSQNLVTKDSLKESMGRVETRLAAKSDFNFAELGIGLNELRMANFEALPSLTPSQQRQYQAIISANDALIEKRQTMLVLSQ